MLANEKLSKDALSDLIGRSPEAVVAVRAGVKYWRKGEDTHNKLSKMMIRILSEEESRT